MPEQPVDHSPGDAPGSGKSKTKEKKDEFWFQPEWDKGLVKRLLSLSIFIEWPNVVLSEEVQNRAFGVLDTMKTIYKDPTERQDRFTQWITVQIFTYGVTLASLVGWKNSALVFEEVAVRMRQKCDEWLEENK